MKFIALTTVFATLVVVVSAVDLCCTKNDAYHNVHEKHWIYCCQRGTNPNRGRGCDNTYDFPYGRAGVATFDQPTCGPGLKGVASLVAY
ncbi:hypothetical protein Ptr902_09250 [Pyrenophora tritici-repentis]|nr:hypothetical protein Ptr902_09250 [Pyrenophora tritici-repentis]